ncbi:MAG: hypothetical protein U0794_06630 [Isosphaeraceae bacterium]
MKRSTPAVLFALSVVSACHAGDLTLELGKAKDVTLVGALRRFDAHGKPVRPVDPKAKIDAPTVDARAEGGPDGRWVFRGLAPGTYDLVVLTRKQARIEGFRYPPVAEFDPSVGPDAPAPDDDVRDEVVARIRESQHYENKVEPLFLATTADDQVRVLMQLVRDLPTSYDAEYGKPIATVRHEVWQFTRHTGAWVKDRRTVVLDRILLPRAELARWTWVWEPALGGIQVEKAAKTIQYDMPDRFDPTTTRGWIAR